MLARMVLQAFVYEALGVCWFIEQPRNSMMAELPRFKFMAKSLVLYRISLRMGDYGADTEKPSWLYTTSKELENIGKLKTRHFQKGDAEHNLATSYVDGGGNRRCVGNQFLKGSQAYPRGFGVAVHKVYMQHQAVFQARAAAIGIAASSRRPNILKLFNIAAGNGESKKAMWGDAKVTEVFTYLAS